MNGKSRILAPAAFFASAALAIGFAPAALAQAAGGQSGSSPNDVAASRDGGEIGELVVTAQRRSERQQDVPLSVSAFSGAQLATQGITTSSDLTQVTPGLTVTESLSSVQPFIRGIGSTTQILGETGSVATYIDGVYIPVVQAGIYDLANIESIEVLKGPQGTLFGRNTAGGAINITTRAPEFTPTGNAEISYGNFHSPALRGYVSGPMSARVAASVAMNYSRHDGIINDLFHGVTVGDGESLSIRGGLQITPSDKLKILINADYSHLDDPTAVLARPMNGFRGRTSAMPYPQGPYDYVGNVTGSLRARQDGASMRANYEFSAFDFVSITALRNHDVHSIIDSDASPIAYVVVDNVEKGQTLSQEFQFLSTGTRPLQWIAGAYYSSQKDQYAPLLVNTSKITADLHGKVYAAYANATYKRGAFEITGGLRYNSERKGYTAARNDVVLVPNALVPNVSRTWNSTTPRVVLAYHPDRDFLAYASYSEGFKSGAFNVSGFATRPLDPETIEAFEVGIKCRPIRAVTFNAAAFRYQSKNIQVQSQNPLNNLQLLANAAQAHTKGIELDLTLQPVQGLSLQAGLSYLDAKFTSFPNAQVFVPFPPPAAPALPDSLGNRSITQDVAGNRMVRSPELTFNFGASYKIALVGGGSVIPSVNLYSTSSYYWDVGNRLKQEPFNLVNAEVNWNLPGDHLTLGVWGKNLGDVTYFRTLTPNSQTDRAIYADPRTYGVRMIYRF